MQILRSRSAPLYLLAALMCVSLPAASQQQHFVFISDTQYPWTDKLDNGQKESDATTQARSQRFIVDQAKATLAYRESLGGVDKVPLFINGDITAYGHGWQRWFMYNEPFRLYGRNTFQGLGNHDYGNNVNNCANNGCARDMYLDMLGWATEWNDKRDFDYSSYRQARSRQLFHIGSLAYSVEFNNVLVVQLQNEPTYQKSIKSNGGEFVAEVLNSLEFLKHQLQWAREAGKDVILAMHKPPYDQWNSRENAQFKTLLRNNKDLILAVMAGHQHKRAGLYKHVEGIPVYLSGASHYSTWLTARYDNSTRTLAVNLVQNNDWKAARRLGSTTATAARRSIPLPRSHRELNGGWGNWGAVAMCPEGEFITTMQLKSEPSQGKGDDTALNAARFRCARPGKQAQHELVSKEGKWGNWTRSITCAGNKPATGFVMRIEDNQGSGDDAAMVDFALRCSGGDELHFDGLPTWGKWGPIHRCPANSALAGFTSKVEDDQGRGQDDTALNRIQMFCRPLN